MVRLEEELTKEWEMEKKEEGRECSMLACKKKGGVRAGVRPQEWARCLVLAVARFQKVEDLAGRVKVRKCMKKVDAPARMRIMEGECLGVERVEEWETELKKNEVWYELKGVVRHLGRSLEEGHYVVCVREGQSLVEWSDDEWTKVGQWPQDGCLFLYERVRERQGGEEGDEKGRVDEERKGGDGGGQDGKGHGPVIGSTDLEEVEDGIMCGRCRGSTEEGGSKVGGSERKTGGVEPEEDGEPPDEVWKDTREQSGGKVEQGEGERRVEGSSRSESTTCSTQYRIWMRDLVSRDLGLEEQGREEVEFRCQGTVIAKGYRRIVFGSHGPNVEFDRRQVMRRRWRQERVKNRETCYYQELFLWPRGKGPMLYEQVREVRQWCPPKNLPSRWSRVEWIREPYADYRPGRFYLSVDWLRTEGRNARWVGDGVREIARPQTGEWGQCIDVVLKAGQEEVRDVEHEGMQEDGGGGEWRYAESQQRTEVGDEVEEGTMEETVVPWAQRPKE